MYISGTMVTGRGNNACNGELFTAIIKLAVN